VTKRTLVLAAAAAFALPHAAFAQQTIAPVADPAVAAAPVTTAPAAISPAAAYPAATPAYPGAAAAYPASTAYPAASYPPQMPGAVTGSVAADRDGDGVIDGYYTSDGIYHPNMTPSLPPARLASRRGERG
jgi:hypothetical protein